jgi:hypothetical protein
MGTEELSRRSVDDVNEKNFRLPFYFLHLVRLMCFTFGYISLPTENIETKNGGS